MAQYCKLQWICRKTIGVRKRKAVETYATKTIEPASARRTAMFDISQSMYVFVASSQRQSVPKAEGKQHCLPHVDQERKLNSKPYHMHGLLTDLGHSLWLYDCRFAVVRNEPRSAGSVCHHTLR